MASSAQATASNDFMQDAEAVCAAGFAALHRQDSTAAEALFLRVTQDHPSYAKAWQGLVELNLLRSDPQAAIDALEKARAADASPEMDAYTAMILLRLGDSAQAETLLLHFANRAPNHARLPFYVGKMKAALGDAEGAQPLLLEATRRDPRDHEAWYALGLLHYRAKQYQEAHQAIMRALEIVPTRLEYDFFLVRLTTETFQFEAAEQLLTLMHVREPEHPRILSELCNVFLRLQKFDQARNLTEKLITLYPENATYKHQLAAMQGTTTASSPDAYVRSLFDHYSANFDEHLVQRLDYKTPAALAEIALTTLREKGCATTNLSLLDLGCGTGISAEVLQQETAYRIGVDLSPKMLEKAAEKTLYNALHEANIIDYCMRDDAQYDIVAAMDVFVYIGDLSPALAGMKARVKAEGVIAFSVENGDDAPPYVLRKTMRYAHSAAYVEQLAADQKLKVLAKQATVLRKEHGADMQGYLFVLGT